MPTVEDYFDDDTDLPLPSSSSSSAKPRNLRGSGLQGALLEEIASDDDDDFDLSKLTEQNRGIFGENAQAPPPSVRDPKGKMVVRDDLDVPSGQQKPPQMNPNTPMGGFMGDMMAFQKAEDERIEKMRKQFGNARVGGDPSEYKT